MARPPMVPGDRASSQLRIMTRRLWLNYWLLGLLTLAAWLREMPSFWRGLGGAPFALRAAVKFGFAPLLVAVVMILVGGLRVAGDRAGSPEVVRSVRRRALIQLAWVLGLVGFVVFNNFDNLFHGRPWHWHRQAVNSTRH